MLSSTRTHGLAFTAQAPVMSHDERDHRVWIDSACTKSIFRTRSLLINVRPLASPQTVRGIGNSRIRASWEGDYPLTLRDSDGTAHLRIIKGVLLCEGTGANLLGTNCLQDSGVGFTVPPCASLPTTLDFVSRRKLHRVSLPKRLGLWSVPDSRKLGLVEIRSPSFMAFMNYGAANQPRGHQLRPLAEHELWHLRLNHAHPSKVAKLSRRCIGIRHPLADVRNPCHSCMDNNATRNDAPPSSTTEREGVWHVDLMDLGPEALSLGGHRYVSIFTIAKSRFVYIELHSTKDEFPQVLERVFARAGKHPKILRTDGAGEYFSPAANNILLRHGIKKETSNAEEQHGNGRVETIVNALGKGMRVALNSALLTFEFWGFSAVNWVDVYNHLPHASLNGLTPWEAEHGTLPDVSWFRPFGCRVTVFRGRDNVAHHKLAPRGEPCVYMGLGFYSGHKGWVCWSPRLRRLFVTRNCRFDETFMPMRTHDQRILGFYDNTPRKQMLADQYGDPAVADGVLDELLDMPLPFEPEEVETQDPARHEQPFSHPEADALLRNASTASGGASTSTTASGGASTSTTASGGASTSTTASGGATQDALSERSRRAAARTISSGGANSGLPSILSSAGESSPAPAQTNSTAVQYLGDDFNWETLGPRRIDDVNNYELTEWLIGHGITLSFRKSAYFPSAREPGKFLYGHVYDTTATHPPRAKVLIMRRSDNHEEPCQVVISNDTDATRNKPNIRQAVLNTFPKAVTMNDLLAGTLGDGYQPEPAQGQDDSDHASDEDDSTPAPPAKRQRTRVKPQRYAGSHIAAWCLSAVHDAFNIGQDNSSSPHCDRSNKKLTMRSDTEGASFVAFMATHSLLDMAPEYAFNAAFLPPEPRSQRDARQRSDRDLWLKAEKKELDTLWNMGTFQVVDRPKNYDPLPLQFVYKLKVQDGDFNNCIHKARLVVRGNLQYEHEYGETYAPTAKLWVIRMLAAIAAQEGMKLKKFDLTGAFLVADMDRELYVEIPGYAVPEGKAILLKKALYGGRSSGALYAKEISTWLKAYGFKPTSVDETLFKLERNGKVIIISLYVDDGMCATNDEKLYKEFIKDLSAKYHLSDQGNLDWHLGMKFTRDEKTGSVHIDQTAYIESVVKRFGMEGCKPKATPMVPNVHLSKSDSPEVKDKEQTKIYQQLIGSLMYISCGTRPDIAYAVSTCAQFMSNPGPRHMEAAKHIVRYLKGTSKVGLTYSKQTQPELVNRLYGYVDADHASDSDDRRSVGGYVLMLGGAAVSWSSRKIKVVALSSFESEWYSASICGCEVTVVRRILEEIGYAQGASTKIMEDNAACIYSSMDNKPMNPRSKHIDTRVFKLKEFVRDGIMTLVKIGTDKQVADNLTKPLHHVGVEMARSVMSGAGFVEGTRPFLSP